MELTKKEAIALYAILGRVDAGTSQTKRIFDELHNYIQKLGLSVMDVLNLVTIDNKYNNIRVDKDELEKLCN